jgi:hypothetical protein
LTRLPGHVEQAVEASRRAANPLRTADVGDARELTHRDASVDAVLLLGHRNPVEHPRWFSTAYFHTPEELAGDVAGAGFDVDGPVAVEGPWPVHPNLLDGAAKQEAALAAIRRLERDPSVLGGSPHLLVCGRKPR